ncbi:MAG: AraC family transcriptional regulator [Spirochaetota bacterium]
MDKMQNGMDEKKRIIDTIRPETLRIEAADWFYFDTVTPHWSIDDQLFADYDLFICFEGEALCIVNGKEHLLSEGMAFLMRKGLNLTAVHTARKHFRVFAQHFEIKLFGTIDLFSLIDCSVLVRFSRWAETKAAVESYIALKRSGSDALKRYGLFLAILSDYFSDASVADASTGGEHSFIVEMLSIIDKDIAGTNVVETALARSPFGPRYTAALFKKTVGMTPKKYCLTARIARAKDMLYAGATVREASRAVGYEDELYFSRLFKRYEGRPPEAFKRFS